MATYAFDPYNSILIIDGYRVTAFADGTMIEIEANEDDFKAYHGATGANWVKQKDHGVKITFTTRGDSADNDVLSAKRNIQRAVPAPAFESYFKEVKGSTKVAAHRCRFVKIPKIERGTDHPKVEWTVESLAADINVGSML
jgi:hypothetical protein